MEKVTRYKDIIQETLERRASIPVANAPDLERRLIFNKDRTEFILLTFGWHDKRYRHGLVFHIEVKNGKVWVHEDNTDVGVATKLVENGIPKSDIILGFLAEYAREVSGFAVA